MERDSIIIVSLTVPREKIWGRLLSLTPAGVTVQGVDLSCFDDWLRQVLESKPRLVPLSTAFYPIHRVERIIQDESCGEILSVAEQFSQRVGMSVLEYLQRTK
jgi:hypothetical protein